MSKENLFLASNLKTSERGMDGNNTVEIGTSQPANSEPIHIMFLIEFFLLLMCRSNSRREEIIAPMENRMIVTLEQGRYDNHNR